MRKLFVLILFLFLSTFLYASQFTTNYNLEIPSIGARDWQPAISRDIISLDTIMGTGSAVQATHTTQLTILSNDAVIQDQKIQILSNDTVIQDQKIAIISSDSAINLASQNLKIQIISNDISIYPPVIISRDYGIISRDVGVVKTSIPSYPLSIANGGTASAVGYTVVSNDVAALKLGGTSKFVQVVNTQTGAVASGTTSIPNDDTIPANTEGDQYMSLAITPTSATNVLKIDVVFNHNCGNGGSRQAVALFQDTTGPALAVAHFNVYDASVGNCVTFTHYMVAGTTSATTFKVRAGANSGQTTTFNGNGGNRLYGGVMASSITIMELVP